MLTIEFKQNNLPTKSGIYLRRRSSVGFVYQIKIIEITDEYFVCEFDDGRKFFIHKDEELKNRYYWSEEIIIKNS